MVCIFSNSWSILAQIVRNYIVCNFFQWDQTNYLCKSCFPRVSNNRSISWDLHACIIHIRLIKQSSSFTQTRNYRLGIYYPLIAQLLGLKLNSLQITSSVGLLFCGQFNRCFIQSPILICMNCFVESFLGQVGKSKDISRGVKLVKWAQWRVPSFLSTNWWW